MSAFNTLLADMTCPRCFAAVEAEIQLSFGMTNQLDFRIGDTYPWWPRKAYQNGGRPEGGNLDEAGYGSCTRCHGTFFVKVRIRKDMIEDVAYDPSIPDYDER